MHDDDDDDGDDDVADDDGDVGDYDDHDHLTLRVKLMWMIEKPFWRRRPPSFSSSSPTPSTSLHGQPPSLMEVMKMLIIVLSF